ncbi:CHAT domain-containing protein [Actinoallomurus rhizosphaericola]|uniref:CHAT domain-containing protein n=1 Tax=Actinoallomurus rhizosphaericola TaxID=2952536 RepID=UPI0020906910|nr:CHAT domain-containing protein [Actinoallomurus rhizosphaericola]MCO5994359.1 CHAT domain-containing protein [Actinoallomurus rhizosphaericola]
MAQEGRIDAAIALLRQGVQELLASDEDRTFEDVVVHAELSTLLGDLQGHVGDVAGCRATFELLRDTSRAAGVAHGELLALVNLALLDRSSADFEGAVERAREFVQIWCEFEHADRGLPKIEEFLPPEDVATALGSTALAAYQEKQYEQAAAMADLTLRIVPEDKSALFAGAYAAFRLGRFAETVDLFGRFIAVLPERATSHVIKAAALLELGQREDALQAVDEAIRLEPEEPRHLVSRARMRREVGRLQDALRDMDACVELALSEKDRLAESPATSKQEAYLEEVPTDELMTVVVVDRLALLEQMDGPERALQAARDAVADERLSQFADLQAVLGMRLSEAGDHRTALGGFTRAVEAGLDERLIHLPLAGCLVSLDRVGPAVDLLERMRAGGLDLEGLDAAARLLRELTARHPGDPRARRVLAHVLLDQARPVAAMEELERVLAQRPDDWHALMLHGMAYVTTAYGDEEQVWNQSFDGGRIQDGLRALIAAVEAAPPGNDQPLNALRWLFQQAVCIPNLSQALLAVIHSGSEPFVRMLQIIPGLQPVLGPIVRYHVELNPRQMLEESTTVLEAARAMLTPLKLPIFAAHVDLLLADVLLRRSEVQRAIDHLLAAESVFPYLADLPNWSSSELTRRRAEEVERDGRDFIGIDMDHMELSVVVQRSVRSFAGVLRADITARIGDQGMALEQLRSVEGIIVDFHRRSSQILAVKLLRDTGEYEQALDVLKGVRKPEGTVEAVEIANLEATIRLLQGDQDRAEQILRETLQMEKVPVRYKAINAANLASTLQTRQAHEEALRVLSDHPPAPDGQLAQHAAWHGLRGVSLAHLDRHAEALDALVHAIDLYDGVRGRLRAEEDRIGWQTRHLHLLRTAVSSAVLVGRIDTALELMERGRARAFVDTLSVGHPLYGARAAELAAAVKASRERRRLLLSLVTGTGSETETLRELAALGRDLGDERPVSPQRIADEISQESQALRGLEQRLMQHTLGSRESVAGRVSTAEEVRRLLETDPGGPRVLLVEMAALADETYLALLATADGGVRLEVFEAPDQDLLAAARDLVGTPTTGTRLSELLAPLSNAIRDASEPGDLVCFVPAGPLHHLPLHAVTVDGVPLIERNPTCYLPSASVLAQCRARNAQRSPSSTPAALVVGDSRSDLVHARSEARAVAALLGTRPYLGASATKTLLTATGGSDHDVIHLACHAYFDQGHSNLSGVAFGDTSATWLTAEEVYDLRLNARLVTLSACESGLGEHRPGEEVMGLARAFMTAGAVSLVVSLWAVDDLSTGLLMEEFYDRLLNSSEQAAAALRAAQLWIRDLTIGEAIERVAARMDNDPGESRLAIARLSVRAGDLARAIGCYEDLLASEPGAQAAIERRLRLLRLKAEAPPVIDYGRRPFADPYHWAAFILVGDWQAK